MIYLNDNWTLLNTKKGIELDTSIPFSVYDVLIKNNIIPDPFIGENEKIVDWVHNDEWKLKKIVEIEKDGNNYIEFNGIDTIADLYVNSKKVFSFNNFFKPYIFKIQDLFSEGKNVIEIIFKSNVKEAFSYLGNGGVNIHLHSSAIPTVENIRKPQYSFGWDWGPALPDIGILYPIKIINDFENQLPDYYIKQKFNDDFSKVDILIEFEDKKIDFDIEITLEDKDNTYYFKKLDDKNYFIEIKSPKLWWIKEFGEPFLYNLNLQFKYKEKIFKKKQNLGLREIKLIRDKDKWGESFYFKLNGIPVWAKGANWIPVDSFINRGIKNNLYENLIDNALKSNFNMIRVWGGGIYEIEKFYDLCDENGILVWQDFTFACKTPPIYEDFIDNIKEEFEYQIKRLRNKTSLAILVGNNEIEEGWVNWGWNDILNNNVKKVYSKIFEDILPQIMNELDPQRPYWPSSPSSGGNFEKTTSENYGDSHFWKVWHSLEPLESYLTNYSRFMSEFGFESFPDIKTIKYFAKDEDMNFYSNVMENHQKNPAGNKKIFDYINMRFDFPRNFESQVILSQISQAEAMKFGVEHWRRNKQDYRCMGSLYWQFNDCWPVASWSSIDYFGRWKALQYFAKNFYKPIILSASKENDYISIYFINDLNENFKGYAEIIIYDEFSNIIDEEKIELTGDKLSVKQIFSKKIKQANEIIFYKLYNEKNKPIFEDMFFTNTFKKTQLQNPEISYEIKEDKLIIKSKKLAYYVHISSEEADLFLEENYFHMPANYEKALDLPKNIKENIQVNSLYDLYKKQQ